MERFNNLFNGYGFNTNEYIRKGKVAISGYVKDEYKKILEEEKSITREEVEKKIDSGLSEEVQKYLDNEKMNDYLYNEKVKILQQHDDYLKENAKKEEEERKWQSKIDR